MDPTKMSTETLVNSEYHFISTRGLKQEKRKKRAATQAVQQYTSCEALEMSPSSTLLDWACPISNDRPLQRNSSSSSLSSKGKSTGTSSPPTHGGCYTILDADATSLHTFESLLLQYGTASHMGARDHSYGFYINSSRTGALVYKKLDNVAVISGDPLCEPDQHLSLLQDFQKHCKRHGMGIAMIAASDLMSYVARQQKWMSIRFGTEKNLDPTTNEMLLGRCGKRTVSKCRQLVKQGTAVDLYCPACDYDAAIEKQLAMIYEDWCLARNQELGTQQAFMTVYDILALPRLMAFVYSKDADGKINGFAALRKLGDGGYHIDPFIATANAPKGTSDLLLYKSMVLAKELGITKLSLGFEVASDLEDMYRVPKILHGLIRKTHRRIFEQLHFGGKKTFFDRFHPDERQDSGLWILYPQRPSLKHLLATMHFANIRMRSVIK